MDRSTLSDPVQAALRPARLASSSPDSAEPDRRDLEGIKEAPRPPARRERAAGAGRRGRVGQRQRLPRHPGERRRRRRSRRGVAGVGENDCARQGSRKAEAFACGGL